MINKRFPEFAAKKQELNCGTNVLPVIKYLEDLYGKYKTKEFIEPLGLPITFLENKRNWISYEFYIALLERLVEITGNDKSPFYAPFSMKTQSLFEDFYYGTYMAVFSDSPKQGYRFAFNRNFALRYTKIGTFEIIEETKNSMTVKLKMHNGFTQNKLNCLTIQGFMSSFTIGWGLPPAEVQHSECAAEGASNCVYKIVWKPKNKSLKLYRYLFIGAITLGEIFLYSKNILDIKDIIITVLFLCFSFVLVKYLSFFNTKNKEEVFNYKKNMSIIEAMEKIENDYYEINAFKLELENRNTFLSIINEISNKIADLKDFNLLLLEVSKIIVNRLKFIKGTYFQINKTGDIYNPIFEINNNNIIGLDRTESFSEMNISLTEYENICNLHGSVSIKKAKENGLILSENILSWLSSNEDNVIYFIPIETFDLYSGFFCFIGKEKEHIPKRLIVDLFNNISSQLKIGYEKFASNKIIENILSSIPASVLIFDIETKEISYVNNIFLSSFPIGENKKRNTDDVIGNNLFEIIPFNEQAIKNINDCSKNISPRRKTMNFQTSFGNRVIEYNIFNINQSNKKYKYAGIILTDITETINFEQKILINEKLLALGKVASGIAHEINNPLYVVLANAEEIADDKTVTQEVKKYANEIVDYTVGISNIIKDLSSYSKSLRNESIGDVDLNSTIEESLKIVKYSLNFMNVEIIKYFSEIPKIQATKGEIEQVFINLLKNALHAMNGNGKIEITTMVENNTIVTLIKDSGIGIPEENLPHIFDLFFTTKEKEEGTGQGLHIVKKILSKYNFSIKVESKVNVGTIFYLYFPINKK